MSRPARISGQHSAILTALPCTGVDWVQENVLGQGKQDNESAVEQAKDEQISGLSAPRPLYPTLMYRASLLTADMAWV